VPVVDTFDVGRNRNPIVKWTCAFNGLMSTASLLLPLTAASESHVQTAAPTARVTATASVNFKIVIPKVLSMQMNDGNSLSLDARTVTIMSSGHTVSLNATGRTANSTSAARGNVILSSAARKGIAQVAQCSLDGKLSADSRMTVCTVSTP
jgi:hypothetical protein